jgi:AP-2 complex subunit mu-1
MVDAFQMHIMQTKELGGCLFFYMRISNVYFVIVVRSNANVACAFQLVFTIKKKKKNLLAFIFQYL